MYPFTAELWAKYLSGLFGCG